MLFISLPDKHKNKAKVNSVSNVLEFVETLIFFLNIEMLQIVRNLFEFA